MSNPSRETDAPITPRALEILRGAAAQAAGEAVEDQRARLLRRVLRVTAVGSSGVGTVVVAGSLGPVATTVAVAGAAVVVVLAAAEGIHRRRALGREAARALESRNFEPSGAELVALREALQRQTRDIAVGLCTDDVAPEPDRTPPRNRGALAARSVARASEPPKREGA
jgi:hypothetical protein